VNDDIFICDGGTGLRELGIDLRWREQKYAEYHMFFSHMHWDHIQGFPFFEPAYAPGSSLWIYGTGRDDTKTHSLVSGQMGSDYFPVDFGDLGGSIKPAHLDDEVTEICGVGVSYSKQPHPGGSLAYKFEHEGKSVVYATDSELDLFLTQGKEDGDDSVVKDPDALRVFSTDYVDFIRGADLLIHDAQYTDEEYVTRVGWGHPRYTTVVDLAVQAEVKRLALYHHDPMHSDREIDAKVDGARERAQMHEACIEIFAARESLVIRID
jgi:phosphoribosyl 1,2-cyclic phosphodiesterase